MQHFLTGIFQSFSMCGLRNRIVHILAFRPPQATYELRLRESKKRQQVNKKQRYYSFDDSGYFNKQNNTEQQLILTNDQQYLHRKRKTVRNPELYPEYDFIKMPNKKIHSDEEILVKSDICKVTSYFLNQNNNQQIASVHLDRNSDYVMLFSHGNACDLGIMIDKFIKLVHYTKINVFAYEYSGYGQSKGKSNDITIIRNIQVAYNFLIHQLGYKPTQIIVYGYSIGSGPSVTLASNPQFPIGGLIIESGFSSGLRVINNKIEDTPYYDLFPNIDRIQLIQSPIFIIHGANDKIISEDHAKQLAQKSNNLYDLWIPQNVGHCGIDTDIQYRKCYFKKLKEFVDCIINNINYLQILLFKMKVFLIQYKKILPSLMMLQPINIFIKLNYFEYIFNQLPEYQLIQKVQLQVQRIQKKYPLISNVDQFQIDISKLFSIEDQETLKKQLLIVFHQQKLSILPIEFNQLSKKDNQIIIKSINSEIKLAMNGRLTYIQHQHNISYQIFSNKCMYHGQVLNNKPNGEGCFRWNNGEQYIGQWSNAQKHGFGQWIGTQDDYYIGQWVNGQQDGLGEHKWNGDIYFGQWKNSVKNGYGVEQFQNGDKYIGNYFYGKPQGSGEYRWIDGSVYLGQFLEGMRHGHGRYVNKNGIIYEGEYVNDQKNGIGQLINKDGTQYYGSFTNDHQDGQGISTKQTIEGDQIQNQQQFLNHSKNQEKLKKQSPSNDKKNNSSSYYQSQLYQTYLNSYQQPSFRQKIQQKLELPQCSKSNNKSQSQSTRSYSMNHKRTSQIQKNVKQNQKSTSIDLKDIYIGDAYRTIKKQQATFKDNNYLFLLNNNKKSIKNVFVY
ncbi:unnamed protein product [Paramecium sonneborni]|uniref:Uncharacterized protein n=1 Tax=Paramecium sonneborni TaxID=65129 RepID=A0A8S1LPL9_9CILI|nr:unnamed protein product [Paramecium sonneborni]